MHIGIASSSLRELDAVALATNVTVFMERDTKMDTSMGSVLIHSGRVYKPRWVPLQRDLRELGRWGEWIALKHLRKLGWDIVARKWKGFQGEVDLIAYDGPFLVFVEVKTRRGPTSLPGEENVDWKKERKLDELAFDFLLRHEIANAPVRLDVIAVETPDLREFVLRHYRSV